MWSDSPYTSGFPSTMASTNPDNLQDDEHSATMPLHIDTNISLDTSMGEEATPPTPGQLRNTPVSSALQKRRSSTRSIKRKKFDDELVESSLTKSNYTRVRLSSTCSTSSLPALISNVPSTPVTTNQPLTPVGNSAASPIIPDVAPSPIVETPAVVQLPTVTVPPMTSSLSMVTSQITVPTATMTTSSLVTTKASIAPVDVTSSVVPIVVPTPVIPVEKKKSKSSSKRSKKSKPPPAGSTKDLGRWKPQDDLALINAVQQTCDLTAVFHGVKFTCNFTLKEIQERWYALMYDSVLSKLAIQAIKQLHPDVVAEVNSKALYSKEEESLLKSVTSTSQPTVDTFEELLSKNAVTFHSGRTGKALHNHWLLMKQYHLLPDQSVPPMPKGDHVLNFSDAEDMINEEELKDPTDETLEQELSVADRRQKREIRHVEQELPKWQVLVDSVTGISPPDFDNQTLAVLRGRLVRYLMRSREITLGRANKDNQIDVDLSLEGPAWKISRRQGMIKLKSNGDFYIANEGKRPLYIDGKPVMYGGKQKLNNNSVVEISCLRFIFLINQDLIAVIRQESQKAVT